MSSTMASPAEDVSSGVVSFDRERERIHRQMLSSVSHDLKTPLASIIGSLEVYARMQDKLTPEKRSALIEVALHEAQRLDTFITNILDMAKLESGSVKPKQESVEIGSLVRNCVARMDSRLRGSTIEIRPLETPLETLTDAVLLTRAVGLVLDNAVKYGGVPSVIWIECAANENREGRISIRDNGSGIPHDRVETVFSKYTRLDREDQQNAGTGLGLAIAREIMRLLDGRITAANHPDGGAVVTLSFPLR